MIRDKGELKLTLYIEGVSTPPLYRGSLGGTVGSDFPPKLPLRGVGGQIQGTVVGSLNKVSLVGLVELNKDSLQESKAKQSPCNRSGSFVTSCLVYFLPRRAVPKPGRAKGTWVKETLS